MIRSKKAAARGVWNCPPPLCGINQKTLPWEWD
jgi:hypothetical protein